MPVDVLRQVLDVKGWHPLSACGDPERAGGGEWFPEQNHARDTATETALKVCAACPVRLECLMHALIMDRHRDRGIFGGMSPRQRSRLKGRPYHPESFSKTFDRRLDQEAYSDLPKIRLHDLRHTWATLALVAGVDVAIVSKRLGHSSPMVTWQTYQHVVKGMQTDAAEKVAALIFGA